MVKLNVLNLYGSKQKWLDNRCAGAIMIIRMIQKERCFHREEWFGCSMYILPDGGGGRVSSHRHHVLSLSDLLGPVWMQPCHTGHMTSIHHGHYPVFYTQLTENKNTRSDWFNIVQLHRTQCTAWIIKHMNKELKNDFFKCTFTYTVFSPFLKQMSFPSKSQQLLIQLIGFGESVPYFMAKLFQFGFPSEQMALLVKVTRPLYSLSLICALSVPFRPYWNSHFNSNWPVLYRATSWAQYCMLIGHLAAYIHSWKHTAHYYTVASVLYRLHHLWYYYYIIIIIC